MTHPVDGQRPDTTEDRGWVARSRDGILLVVGVVLIMGELGGSLFGRPTDPLIIAASLALLGIVPNIPKKGD
jgi:hypothetical protein